MLYTVSDLIVKFKLCKYFNVYMADLGEYKMGKQ